MDDLIARLEAATDGDRGLDRAIAEAIGLNPKLFPGGGQYVSYDRADGSLPRYTTSLDAALTLLPEGRHWLVRSIGEKGFAVIAGSAPASGATPALAASAAALKALAQKEG